MRRSQLGGDGEIQSFSMLLVENSDKFTQLEKKKQLNDLKQYICYLTISVGQESRHSLAGCSAWLQSRYEAGLHCHLEA